ncbi:MAG: MoaD/ThiS family protein [Pseudomonadota bacterium]
MSITVRYFASVRESLGRGEDRIAAAGVASVADVWRHAAATPLPPRLLAAINQQHAGLDATVHDGDEVAFFPPVTGG